MWVVYFLKDVYTVNTPICGGNDQHFDQFSGLALPWSTS